MKPMVIACDDGTLAVAMPDGARLLDPQWALDRCDEWEPFAAIGAPITLHDLGGLRLEAGELGDFVAALRGAARQCQEWAALREAERILEGAP